MNYTYMILLFRTVMTFAIKSKQVTSPCVPCVTEDVPTGGWSPVACTPDSPTSLIMEPRSSLLASWLFGVSIIFCDLHIDLPI